MKIFYKKENQKRGLAPYLPPWRDGSGFVMLFAVTLAAILLSIALGVADVALKEVQFGTSAKDADDAFFAADSGVEQALYNDKTSGFYPTGSASNFIVSGLGSSGQSCANVTVDKTVSPAVSITANGYNIGNSSCNSANPNRVERELVTTYGSVGGGSGGSDGIGGAIAHSDGYTIHTFTSSGTFTAPSTGGTVEVLVVAGGGGGGKRHGGGGGGGGVIYNSSYTVTSSQVVTVTVGTGGAGGTGTNDQLKGGSPGNNSVFGTITAVGGGGGRTYGPGGVSGNGGSGGGGSGSSPDAQPGGNGTSGQGNIGGAGGVSTTSGGGGGGAGGAGGSGGANGGAGGIGIISSITGSSIYYGGGGGGGSDNTGGSSGLGGGGNGGSNGGNTNQTAGVANTGGGGGGTRSAIPDTQDGSPGGDGIVIIRYLTP